MKYTALFAIFSLFLTACNDNKVQPIDTAELLQNLDNPQYVIIDSRNDSLYNGFKDKHASRGGHIKGSIQFTCSWFDSIEAGKFDSFAESKGISKNKTLVIYDSNPDNLACISAEFAAKGYKVRTFSDFISYVNAGYPLESLPNFQYSVSPEWVYSVLQGEKPESYTNDDFMLFEVSWGALENAKAYTQHIVGAYHFDTDWVEGEAPVHNLLEPATIERNLLKNGITKDKTIILYSDNPLAAYRIFWALKWAGVEDVRVLNGNLSTWMDSGFPTETKVNIPQPANNFGGHIPTNPQLSIAQPQQAYARQQQGLKLISSRAWEEYIGEVSGDDAIQATGEPQGAIWGFSGSAPSNVADFYDPDDTLRNPKEIEALWQELGIVQGDQLAFYCGTGWRASVPWFMTQLLGWRNTAVYDGGWNAWQMTELPVQKGAPMGLIKPDAKNDSGRMLKKTNSCRG
ncbi:rhodanese-like domain-containing protein [Basfia succiniciproducens]|uniref:rhodanese-like domain-containing protein n=1 Tax=Basfia succiniciproducens TaxID=653940 RepID=UPI0008C74FF8|nr:rhodanese-like domain-containing protein [Basfia succiniciproducens]SEP87963.1 thiosulfate/3-mercaptopyruvate sulfurtransferase [Basfia succiniciproducens]